jgi:hypothetical protein
VIAIIVAAVLIVAGGAVAAVLLLSGDDDGSDDAKDSPESASVEDFCDGLDAFDAEIDEDADADEQVDRAHELAEDLMDIGTPEDIPEDARHGFEVYVGAFTEIEADDVEAFENAESEDEFRELLGISEEDYADVTAFFTYAGENCFSTDDAPTDIPTDAIPSDIPTDAVPTDFPTEIPSEFLSDFPSDFSVDPEELESLFSDLTASP